MTNRTFFIAALTAATLALPGASLAADYLNDSYYSDSGSIVSDSNQGWAGNYIGAQIGASSSKFPNPFSNRTGALMGGVIGKNLQSGNIVVGGELEANFAEAEHRIGNGGSLQQSWSAVAKAKAGYAMDKTLVYGTLGYGTTRFKAKHDTTKAPGWEGGVLLGAGVEQVISGPLSIKAEYDYMRFSDVKTEVNGVSQRNNLSNHALKAGLNYRF